MPVKCTTCNTVYPSIREKWREDDCPDRGESYGTAETLQSDAFDPRRKTQGTLDHQYVWPELGDLNGDAPDPTPETIKRVRNLAGFTQVEFATIMDVADTTIRNWELGWAEPNPENTRQLKCVLYELEERHG